MAKNVGHNGRRAEPRHVRLYHSVTGCAAWTDLSGNAVKLLIALARLDRGGSNGELFLSARDAGMAIGVTPNTACRCFSELEEHGFIVATEVGRYKPGQRPASKWRLTWLSAPGVGPTRDFERWEPSGNKSPSQKLSVSVSKIDTVVETNGRAVAKIDTASTETSHVSNPPTVSKSDTQVVCHGRWAASTETDQRKHAGNTDRPFRDLIDGETLDDLRDRLKCMLEAAPVGSQTRIAEAAGIPKGTLSKFRDGRGLPACHVTSLSETLDLIERSQAA